MKLYTRTGDGGNTALFNGQMVPKDDPRVAAYGALDELNAHLGVIVERLAARRGEPAWADLHARLQRIQSDLFSIGAELATPADGKAPRAAKIAAEDCARLEGWIDDACKPTPPIRGFILPGGSATAAAFHVARTVCRRAEREVVTLSHTTKLEGPILIYLNRLSDLLFAWARYANFADAIPDVPWKSP